MATNKLFFRLSGTIKHMGLPVSGVIISVLPEESNDETFDDPDGLTQITGPRGDFSFTVPNGRYALDVVPDRGTRFVRQCLKLSVSSNTICSIALNTGYILSGSLQGQPGADLCTYHLSIDAPGLSFGQNLDADGTFSVTLPRGKYTLLLQPGDQSQNPTAKQEVPTLITIHDELEMTGDKTLDFACGQLHRFMGVVKDAAGKPLSGAKATVFACLDEGGSFAANGKTSVSCFTDTHGTFFIDLKPAQYEVHIEPPADLAMLSGMLRQVTVKEETIEEFVLSPGFQIQGVVGFHGEPVTKSCITVGAEGSSFKTVANTDEQGQFSLRLPEGKYKMSMPGRLDPLKKDSTQVSAGWSGVFAISADTDVIVELQDGHQVVFQVLTQDENPIDSCRLFFGPYGTESSLNLLADDRLPDPTCGSTLTGPDGTCEIILPGGVYFFHFHPPAESPLQNKTIRQLSINAETRRKLKLSTSRETDELEGQPAVLQLSIQGTKGLS